MDLFNPKRQKPEAKIQNDIIKMMRYRGWFVVNMHGNMYQSGVPDLYCTHSRYGARWVEVKNPVKYHFTPAQIEDFPKYCANGAGIWILVAGTETEYEKLFKGYNWYQFLSIWK